MRNNQRYLWSRALLLLALGSVLACSGGQEALEPKPGATPTLQPGATMNADGSYTNPDGTIVPHHAATGFEQGAPEGTSTGPSVPTPKSASECSDAEVPASKRLVRLTFNQIANSLRSLVGQELALEVTKRYELPAARGRTFPPLNNPREGSVIVDSPWQTGDAIAQAAGEYVLENFSRLSQCSTPVSTDCARRFSNNFVERAFRRPLSADEAAAHQNVFDGARARGARPEVAAQYGVYAALSAPQFLYRTEFGLDAQAAGPLEPYEMASMISYFVTDGPPDAELLKAASEGRLRTSDELDAQVTRLLQTLEARENLQAAMFSYFGLSTLNTIVIDPAVAPQFTEGLRASMMRETELFINDTLWNGETSDLLTSSTSYLNQSLADLYGVTYPPAGSSPDADGFAKTTLPNTRSGILTQPGYLTTRSSPDKPSVVRRGLLVNASLLCMPSPAFPESLADRINAASANLASKTEREKAEYRAGVAECSGCHQLFDAYGLGLDNFDVIGAYRDADPEGRRIDSQVTLPASAGGAAVRTPREMAQALADSGAFTACLSKNLLSYALAEGSTISTRSCASQAVVKRFESGRQDFSSLIRAVVKSPAFSSRKAGEEQ